MLIIVEANEIDLNSLAQYVKYCRGQVLHEFLIAKNVIHTRATDVDECVLYPSQAWASLNTGLPYRAHRIRWYNDPKCYEQFFWWQAACRRDKKTVLVGTLHSSPLELIPNVECFDAIVPDFFSKTNSTIPTRYKAFQDFNMKMSFSNRRVTQSGQIKKFVASFAKRPRPRDWGIDGLSFRQLARTALAYLSGSHERLRCAQFSMQAAIFECLVRDNHPDLGILFTNHIASALHRYYGTLPDNHPNELPVSSRFTHYKNEIFNAYRLLDERLERLVNVCKKTNSTLLIVSAFGQRYNALLYRKYPGSQFEYRLVNISKLLGFFNIDEDFVQLGAMIPQYTLEFASEREARRVSLVLRKYRNRNVARFGHYTKADYAPSFEGPTPDACTPKGLYLHSDRKKNVLTLTALVDDSTITLKGKRLFPEELGFEKIKAGGHHAGVHTKEGLILYYNLPNDLIECAGTKIDYLNVRHLYERCLYGAKSDYS